MNTPPLRPSSDTSIARPPVEPLVFRSGPQSQYAAVMSELWSILKEFKTSARQVHIILLAVGLLIVLLVNMVGQIFLNRWQGAFFSAIEQRDLPLIFNKLWSFALLILILLGVVVSQTWMHIRMQISLREWLSHRLLDHWLQPGRAYRLGISSDDAVNPDQRIQEDVRNFSEMSTDLTVGLVQASLLLVSFIGVLWAMSPNIEFDYRGYHFHIPGYMVWIAMIYSVLGSWLTAKVGKPLIALNVERYSQEANFRFSLMRVSESAESIAFYRGENDERKIINRGLNKVLAVMRTVSFATARLTWITSGYGWMMIVLPVMMALPGYLHGTLNLGGLMMVVGAFNQVQQSLRWFVDNFARIADWRAALHRVVVFKEAATHVDDYEGSDDQIHLLTDPAGHLSFEATKISLIDGEVVIADATAHIAPKERVLITGESGSGKSTLLRAVGGLWPWGSGIIRLPERSDMMFLPQRPYMPLGTLAGSIAYPQSEDKTDRELLIQALRTVNLEEFIPMLDINERWDRLMSLGQQQRLAFARLLVHKPRWIFLDEATSALDEENQRQMMSLFSDQLKESTLISIGHQPGLAEYHHRTLQLITTQAGTVLRRRPKKEPTAGFWKRLLPRSRIRT